MPLSFAPGQVSRRGSPPVAQISVPYVSVSPLSSVTLCASASTEATVAPSFSKLRYIGDRTFDQTDRGLSAGLGYRLRPTLTLSGFGTVDRLTYDRIDRKDTTVRLGLDLGQQWNPHWSWHATVARERRSSDAVGQDYRETRFFIGVVYRR